MNTKENIEPDAVPSSAEAMGETAQWRWNRQNPRAVVPEKVPWGAPPSTPKFNGTCNGLKGRGIVFDSENLRVDRFMDVRREIDKYVGKE